MGYRTLKLWRHSSGGIETKEIRIAEKSLEAACLDYGNLGWHVQSGAMKNIRRRNA